MQSPHATCHVIRALSMKRGVVGAYAARSTGPLPDGDPGVWPLVKKYTMHILLIKMGNSKGCGNHPQRGWIRGRIGPLRAISYGDSWWQTDC